MKKVLVSLAAMATFCSLFAQSPRVALVELFASASSSSSGKQAGRLDTLLDLQNPLNASYLVYHTAPPQPQDTLAKQTQAAVTIRKSFYNSSNTLSAPAAYICGERTTGGSNQNNPAAITQAKLDSFVNLGASYTISMMYRLSADKDSIFVECFVACTKSVTGNFILRLMLMEQEINFTQPIGSDNKQKRFYNVFRSVLSETPFDNPIKTVGNSRLYYHAGPIPSFIYDPAQLGIVAFIQETATRKVNQSAVVNVPSKLDAKLTSSFSNTLICNPNNFTIPFTLINNGEIDFATIGMSAQLDNQPIQNIVTGISPVSKLVAGATKPLTTPSVTLTPGLHTYRIFASRPNTSPDDTLSNDTLKFSFLVLAPQVPLPINENFGATTNLPSGFYVQDLDNDGVTWRYDVKGAYMGGSALAPCFEMPVGTKDQLFFPQIQLPAGTPYYLSFDRAHAQYTFPTGLSSNDSLSLKVSADCGLTWNKVWSKAGAALATSPAISVELIPNQLSQWQFEAISLAAYAGQGLLMQFEATSDYGNHIYLDNIKVSSSATGTEIPFAQMEMSVFPVPANDVLSVRLMAQAPGAATWRLTDALGKTVLAGEAALAAGEQLLTANVANLSNGIYLFQVHTEAGTASHKVVIAH